ncbi:hypothetical protein PABG_02529 [Paracoccidioides brasiliensis Pb03]|nr:hypothetical protein PABG_02529 [Paracoccidioides brasiliensis Pb03]
MSNLCDFCSERIVATVGCGQNLPPANELVTHQPHVPLPRPKEAQCNDGHNLRQYRETRCRRTSNTHVVATSSFHQTNNLRKHILWRKNNFRAIVVVSERGWFQGDKTSFSILFLKQGKANINDKIIWHQACRFEESCCCQLTVQEVQLQVLPPPVVPQVQFWGPLQEHFDPHPQPILDVSWG